jgi:hypothetical protein
MKTRSHHHDLSPLEFAALMDAAKARAVEARREAINDFWAAVARGIRRAWRAVVQGVRRPGCNAVANGSIVPTSTRTGRAAKSAI